MKNILALAIGFMIAFLLLEIFLRIYNPFQFRQQGDKIVLPSNFKTIHENNEIENLDAIITHSKNMMGFRGAEMPNDFEGWTSIIAVGGSTTECRFLSDGDDWPALLGKKLENDFEKIWINNAGLDGHSTFGHQVLLEDYIIKIKPKYILLLVGCNDVGRDDLNKFDKYHVRGISWRDKVMNNIKTASIFVNLKRSLNAKQKGLTHVDADWPSLGELDSIDVNIMNEILLKHGEYVSKYKSRLNRIIETSLNNDIVPILITQPTVVGEGIDPITKIDLEKIDFCDENGGKVYWEVLEQYNDATRELAESENVFLIDLANKMPKSTEYYYDCFHYNNAGSKMVAEIVFEELRRYLKMKNEK